jgi:hypothetical protein
MGIFFICSVSDRIFLILFRLKLHVDHLANLHGPLFVHRPQLQIHCSTLLKQLGSGGATPHILNLSIRRWLHATATLLPGERTYLKVVQTENLLLPGVELLTFQPIETLYTDKATQSLVNKL